MINCYSKGDLKNTAYIVKWKLYILAVFEHFITLPCKAFLYNRVLNQNFIIYEKMDQKTFLLWIPIKEYHLDKRLSQETHSAQSFFLASHKKKNRIQVEFLGVNK